MDLLITDRQQGKTTYLLALMQKQWTEYGVRVICITVNTRESMRLLKLSRQLGYDLTSWQFMTMEEARGNRGVFNGRHRDQTRVVVDNGDMLFDRYVAEVLPIFPSLVTWSAGPKSSHQIVRMNDA